MEKLPKVDRELLQFHLSSIFSRRQPYLWIDSNNPKVWYFSTLGPEMPESKPTAGKKPQMIPLFAYRPTIDDFIHRVEFRTTEVYDLLVRQIPFLKNGLTCTAINSFMAIFNKNDVDSIKYTDAMGTCTKFVKGKDPTEITIVSMVDELLFDYVVDMHNSTTKLFTKQSTIFDISIVKDIINKGAITHISTVVDLGDSQPTLKLPMEDGLTSVSLLEYPKRTKVDYTLRCFGTLIQHAVKVLYRFETEFISVTSICPRALWFPKF